MKIEFSPLSIVAGLIVLVAACLIVVRSCREGERSAGNTVRIETPKDTNFVETVHKPVKSSQLKRQARVPSDVKPSNVDKVVQIKLRTGETLQVTIAQGSESHARPEIYVAKDSAIESVTVLDVKPPLFGVMLQPGAGATVDFSGKFSPSVCFSFFHIDKYRLPVLAADFSGAGIGAGMDILPEVEITAAYWLEFSGKREIKAGVYYEF